MSGPFHADARESAKIFRLLRRAGFMEEDAVNPLWIVENAAASNVTAYFQGEIIGPPPSLKPRTPGWMSKNPSTDNCSGSCLSAWPAFPLSGCSPTYNDKEIGKLLEILKRAGFYGEDLDYLRKIVEAMAAANLIHRFETKLGAQGKSVGAQGKSGGAQLQAVDSKFA